MGFFDEFETPVEDIPTGFGLPIGTYPVILTEIKRHKKEDGTKSNILTFTVDTANDEEGGNRSGKEDIWLTKPVKGDKNAATYASIGKATFLSIGVTEEEMAEPDWDIYEMRERYIGVEGILKVTAGNKGYTKKAFTLNAEESGVSEMAGATADKAEVAFDPNNW